jgi:tetrapyrrole methylase family protein/MazG family protein
MARLRAPDGCPWDREQTHASILSCLVEEAYEFVDAVEREDVANMREELGDLLLQVVFHSQMAREAGKFNVEDVIRELCEKLVRRHPHVFGEGRLENANQVQVQWDELKKAEKQALKETGALGEIPKHLPALLKALKIQKRAAKVGFDWPDWKGPAAKVAEELREFEAEAAQGNADSLAEELGDLLFAVVNLGRFFDLDPERVLAAANAKFVARFRAMEKTSNDSGSKFEELKPDEMERLWEKAKSDPPPPTPSPT